MKEFDLIIAGGGMVGSTAALALSELGLKIALIESTPPSQSNNTSFDQRAVALSAASVRIFQSLKVWKSMKPFSESIKHIHVSDKGHFGFARLKAKDYSIDALGEVIPLDQTGPVLWNRLEQHDRVEIYSPYELINIEQPGRYDTTDSNQKVTVAIKNNLDGNQQLLSAKLLLGADGTFSNVANLAGIDTKINDYQQHAIIANIVTEKSHNNRAFERFTTSGPLALLPLTRNRLSLVWCKKTDEYESLINSDEQSFIQQLQQEFGYRLGQITKVGVRNHYPLSLKVASRPFKQRVLLLGNAAHTLHPIAGQGFNIGIRDVAALTDCIEQIMYSPEADFGNQVFLENYQQSRQKDWQKTILATDWLVRIFSHEFLPVVMTRGIALNFLDKLPLFKQKLAHSAMGITGKSARLTRGLAREDLGIKAKGTN